MCLIISKNLFIMAFVGFLFCFFPLGDFMGKKESMQK